MSSQALNFANVVQKLQYNANNDTVDIVGSTLTGTIENADNLDNQDGSYYLDWTNVTNKPDPTVTLTGAVTGSATMTDLGSISIATTATADPTLTIDGDASGSATFTNLGNATLTLTVADDSHNHIISNISDSTRWWNNFGDDHSTRTSFDASAASYGFGWRYVQGSTNGPGTGGSQFYSLYTGLGDQYPATGAGSYGMYMAIDRDVTNPYLSIRYNENNSLSTWRRISAGAADKLTTARTISLGGDLSGSATFDGSSNITITAAVADDSHNHVWGNIDGGSVNSWGGLRHSTASGYIDFGPANGTYAHIYSDRPEFYFNKDLRVLGNKVFHDGYHPNADKLTTARTISLGGDLSGSASFDGSGNITITAAVANDSHTHDGRYYTESEANSRFVNASGDTMTGNLTIQKNAAKIIVDSSSSGGTTNEQSATISLGESGTGAAALHLSYTGDGYSYIGMSSLGTDNIPDLWAMRMYYQDDNVRFNGITTADESHRAPVFYDSNNTSYKTDPASTSTMNTIDLEGTIRHNGDTNTYIQFHAADQFRVVTGGAEHLEVNNTYVLANDQLRTPIVYDNNNTSYYINPASTSVINEILVGGGTVRLRDATGNYGSLECDGGGTGGYEGFSIGGRVVFMHNNSTTSGLYNDVNNEWFMIGVNNSYVSLYHNGAEKLRTRSDGIQAQAFFYSSDERLKENITNIENAVDKVKKLRGVEYNWRDSGERDIGLIAQEVQNVVPEVVKLQDTSQIEDDPSSKDNTPEYEDLLSVEYGHMVGLLVEAVKEQQTTIEDQQKQIDELKEMIKKLLG